MAKLNRKPSTSREVASRPDLVVNEEGGIAFKPDAKTELMLRTINAMIGESGFYKTGKELDSALRNCIHSVAAVDPEFILKLALYARTVLHLRTAPVVLMGEYSMSEGRGKVPNARKYITDTIQRADEMTELVAYVMNQNKTRNAFKGKLPQVIKYGIADAFPKFDAYQIAKYNRDGEVKLRDVLFLTHVKPKDDADETLFKKLIDGTLEPPETWEVALSTKGASKETWEGIIPKMGYMALLRNLRNFLEKDVNIKPVLERLANPEAVRKSKQFPYRFYSAYREIAEMGDDGDGGYVLSSYRSSQKKVVSPGGKVLDALQDAIDLSMHNVPLYPGVTFVASDNSGSMHSGISGRSKIKNIDIAALFSAMVHKKSENSIVSVFGTRFKIVPLSTRDGTLTNMEKIKNTDVDHSTNAYLAIEYLVKNKIDVDRIVIFSDMQCYSSESRYAPWQGAESQSLYQQLIKYRRTVNPRVFLYSFDLGSYGTMQFPKENGVCLAGGFSEKVLDFIPLFERDRTDMLREIENYKVGLDVHKSF